MLAYLRDEEGHYRWFLEHVCSSHPSFVRSDTLSDGWQNGRIYFVNMLNILFFMNKNQKKDNIERGLSVLISGGSGLIGKYLTPLLLAEGYRVSHLSRQANCSGVVRSFKWDPAKGYLDPEAFEGIDYLVHLAGANIGEQRWTFRRRSEIIGSRVDSANLLFRTVNENKYKLKAFISASAVGYYGSGTSERIYTEEDPPSVDFLSRTCRLMEEAADQFTSIGIRTVRIRSGVVLAKNDGALKRLMTPARLGLVMRLGSGKQYFPWIHIEDLCRIYLKAIKDQNMQGAYNAVAPEHINHSYFVRTMAGVMKRPVILPPVPGWIFKTAMGEMAEIVLSGSRISSEKILGSGFSFRYKNSKNALENIISG